MLHPMLHAQKEILKVQLQSSAKTKWGKNVYQLKKCPDNQVLNVYCNTGPKNLRKHVLLNSKEQSTENTRIQIYNNNVQGQCKKDSPLL